MESLLRFLELDIAIGQVIPSLAIIRIQSDHPGQSITRNAPIAHLQRRTAQRKPDVGEKRVNTQGRLEVTNGIQGPVLFDQAAAPEALGASRAAVGDEPGPFEAAIVVGDVAEHDPQLGGGMFAQSLANEALRPLDFAHDAVAHHHLLPHFQPLEDLQGRDGDAQRQQ